MKKQCDIATIEDGKDILELMESDRLDSPLQLLTVRRDNPYESFMIESPHSKIAIVKDDKDKVIASLAGVPKEVYINSTPTKVCYVTCMKRHPKHEGNIDWPSVFKKLYDSIDAEVYFCRFLEGNDKIQRLFMKKRKNFPSMEVLDEYKIYVISPRAHVKDPCQIYRFLQAQEEDEAAIVEFLNKYGRSRNFFPVIEKLSDIGDIQVSDFYILRKEKEMVAIGALWNRSKVKQTLLKKGSGRFNLYRKFNGVMHSFGYAELPEDNTELDCCYLSFLTAKDDNKDYYKSFLARIKRPASQMASMYIIGTNKSNPKYEVLESIRSLSFDATINQIDASGVLGIEDTPIAIDGTNIELDVAFL